MMALECACGRKMYPDAALLRCPGCGRPTATMGPCSMTSKPEGREVEAREGGTLQVDAGDRVTVDTETEAQVDLLVAFVATLPDGSRVSLPAGTVLREGTLPPEIEPTEPRTLGEQLHEEHDRAAHADGSPCLCDPAEGAILADLTERVGLPREMAPSATPIIDAWRAAGEPAAMTFTAEDAARLTGIAAIFPEPARAPPHTVREEDDIGVRFVDRSQAMIDRNKRALETWNITAHESHLPDPPIGSGCLVYDCWTPCAPGHHHCARHGGADAVPPPSKPRT